MFRKESTIRSVVAVLVALCYLALAGMSAVHEVTHIADRHSCSSGATDLAQNAVDSHPTDEDSHDGGSLPCFFCLSGQPYSTLHSFAISYEILTTATEEPVSPVPGIRHCSYRLPLFRAPPSLS